MDKVIVVGVCIKSKNNEILMVQETKEYQDVVEQYYPIETIVYGIKNNKQDFIDNGRKEIYIRTKK